MRENPLHVVLASPRSFDRQAMAVMFEHSPGWRLLASESSLEGVLRQCHRYSPQAVLLDFGFRGDDVLKVASHLTGRSLASAVGLLDVEFAFYRAKRTQSIPGTAYFTRRDAFERISHELRMLVYGQEVADDKTSAALGASLPERVEDEQRTLVQLTQREEELFELLARGLSVKQAAQRLGLAESTVDNRKLRLMKKLDVQRSAHLTRMAIRAGLID